MSAVRVHRHRSGPVRDSTSFVLLRQDADTEQEMPSNGLVEQCPDVRGAARGSCQGFASLFYTLLRSTMDTRPCVSLRSVRFFSHISYVRVSDFEVDSRCLFVRSTRLDFAGSRLRENFECSALLVRQWVSACVSLRS